MSNAIFRALPEKLGGRNLEEYIGKEGELFWDPGSASIRVSNGQTVGGVPVGGIDSSGYRGYRAVVNKYWGDDSAISQVFIYRIPGFQNSVSYDSMGPITATNAGNNTDYESFTVEGLERIDRFFLLNLYGKVTYTQGDVTGPKAMDDGVLKAFVVSFIENVCYNADDYEADRDDMVANFYNNFDKLTKTLPPLYKNFEFFRNYQTDGWSQYNTETGSGYQATFWINPYGEDGTPGLGWSVNNYGSGYQVGQTFVIPGNYFYSSGNNENQNYQYQGSTPEHDITATITEIFDDGKVGGLSFTGNFLVGAWPLNSIDDGGADQYDTGNFLNAYTTDDGSYTEINYCPSSNATNSNWNNGWTFGYNSYYTNVYKDSIFGLFVDNAHTSKFWLTGGMGADEHGGMQVSTLIGDAQTSLVVDIPQNYIGSNYYDLKGSDRGKHIFGADYELNINDDNYEFPIGTVIELAAGDMNCWVRANGPTIIRNENNSVYDGGQFGFASWTTARLLKVEDFTWILQGQNVWVD